MAPTLELAAILAGGDQVYDFAADTVIRRNESRRFAVVSSRGYHSQVFIRKLRVWIVESAKYPGSSFVCHVAHVFFVRSVKDMFRIYARRIVALVTRFVFRELPMLDKECRLSGRVITTVDPDTSVPTIIKRSDPVQAIAVLDSPIPKPTIRIP